MMCKNCGNELVEGAKFCMECGTKVETELVCAECGMKLPLNAKFCMECGTKVESAESNTVVSPVSMILSILVYTFFSRMFDLMLHPAMNHSTAVA